MLNGQQCVKWTTQSGKGEAQSVRVKGTTRNSLIAQSKNTILRDWYREKTIW